MKTVQVYENEIVKQEDFNADFTGSYENTKTFLKLALGGAGAFAVGGEIKAGTGMNVIVAPFVLLEEDGNEDDKGVALSDASQTLAISAADASDDRYDTIQAKAAWTDSDVASRAFYDAETESATYHSVATRKTLQLTLSVKTGTAGAGHAPDVDAGYFKLGEVLVAAGATSIFDADCLSVTAENQGEENTAWTTQKTATWKMRQVAQLEKVLSKIADANGLKSLVVKAANIAFGVASGEVTSIPLPVGEAISVGAINIAATDGVKAALAKIAQVAGTAVGMAAFVDLNLTQAGENDFALTDLGLDPTAAYEFLPTIAESRSTFRNVWVERKTAATIGVHCWSEIDGEMVEGATFSEGECGVAECGEAECGTVIGETIKIKAACYNTGTY